MSAGLSVPDCTCKSSAVPARRQATRAQLPKLSGKGSTPGSQRVQVHRQRCALQSRNQRRVDMLTRCSAVGTVKDQATGIEFPAVTHFWEGEAFRSLGAAARQKKIAFVGVKVYAITLYVEGGRAARELGVRKWGGFFQDAGTEEYADALVDGAFSKLIQVQLVRNVDGDTFFGALQEALEPRLRLSGDMQPLEQMKAFFAGQNFQKGLNILMLVRPEGVLELVTGDAGSSFVEVKPSLRVESATLCRALLEVYLGNAAVIPEARATWAKGAQVLMQNEEERRSNRKGGGG